MLWKTSLRWPCEIILRDLIRSDVGDCRSPNHVVSWQRPLFNLRSTPIVCYPPTYSRKTWVRIHRRQFQSISDVSIASKDQVNFNEPHAPAENALEAFGAVEDKIKAAIIESRHHWDKHEPRMWSRAKGVSDSDLVNFNLKVIIARITQLSVELIRPTRMTSSWSVAARPHTEPLF